MNLKKIIRKLRSRREVISFMAVGIAAVALVAIFELIYLHKQYPGITINGISVGGLTLEETKQQFSARSQYLQKNGLLLVLEGRNGKTEIIIPANAAGLTQDTVVEYFSIKDTAEDVVAAYNWGRQGNSMQRFKEQSLLLTGKQFNIPVQTHQEAIRSLLLRETKHHFINQAPARFSVDGNGKVTITPEVLGEQMDIEQLVDLTVNAISSLERGPITVRLQIQTPYTTKERLSPFSELAEKLVNFPGIKLYYNNQYRWKISGKALATWLAAAQDGQVTISNEELETFISVHVAPSINNPPENSRFALIEGELIETSAGKPGNIVDIGKAAASIEETVRKIADGSANTAATSITLETITAEPKVTKKMISQYRIKDLLGKSTTDFTGGSKDRQHNIEVGVSKMTGMLIAPGEEFSTVNAIGMVTEEAGFVKEFVIQGNQTVKELGGGLCQLATTLFRTTLDAGLPITERKNHKYVIPYYGPGLDATIYGPHPDFRFVNDTGNYILLQGTAKNNAATFELYGISDGRVATISTPALSNEKPVPPDRNILSASLPAGQITCTTATHKGITADVVYTVTYLDGTEKREIFHSVYEAWPKVCLIGAGW